ncbi:hypothetical protein PVK06_036228 [Gossypium arboreum]|uniref:Uncharacterized protein n=1 Tax=Gossypium arboreum TaxID=29729 RepID=A0ABR0NL76_GOSAR|nr:hypothetical protein PVK06_036228 [Gossypium arboreum]
MEDGSSCFNPDVLRDLVVVFYSMLYQENFVSPKPFRVRNCFPQLSIHEISALTTDISLEEVLHALFGMEQLKAPRVEVRGVGPLKQWFVGNEPIKEDMYVVNMVNQYGEWSRQSLESCHPGDCVVDGANWCSFFTILGWMIWKNRNDLVFGDDHGSSKGLLVLSLAWARSLSRRLLQQNVVFHYELVVLEQPLDGVLHIL